MDPRERGCRGAGGAKSRQEMKIAFIVQRYGTEILGGSEYHCRLIAERLAPKHQVEVLTTCARDYISWKNEYPQGTDRIRGVTVRRFANTRTRDINAFNRYSEWIFTSSHSRDDEMEWVRQQGPWCPALHEYLERNQQNYDMLIFFTYLYAPTLLGVKIAPHEDHPGPDRPRRTGDPSRHLQGAVQRTRRASRTTRTSSAAFSRRISRSAPIEEETVGCGVDLPQSHLQQRERPKDADDSDGPAQPRRRPMRTGRRAGGRTWPDAASSFAVVTGCTARWPCTAGASIRGRAARS